MKIMAKAPKDLTRYQKHFSEETFLQKVMKIARKAGEKIVYLALILYYELTDPDVPAKDKAVLVGALGYLLLPVDLIPDFIPLLGFADDFSALVAAYRIVRGNVNDNVRANAARTMSSWFGAGVDPASLDRQIEQAVQDMPDDQ